MKGNEMTIMEIEASHTGGSTRTRNSGCCGSSTAKILVEKDFCIIKTTHST
jgi:hypothetical protein